MAQRGRLEEIRQIVRRDKEVTVAALSRQYRVTEETIRRDLDKLKAEGLVTRTYGGAVLAADTVLESVDYLHRAQTNYEAKRKIGELAASIIPKKTTIGADASSTVMEAIEAISNRPDIMVLTNSVRALMGVDHYDIRIMSTGGIVNRHTFSMQGAKAQNALEDYYLELVLIGCKALSLTGGVFDSNEEEALWEKRLIERGSRIFLLADHTKFDRVAFVQVTTLEQVDTIITDRKPGDEWMEKLKEWDVQVLWPE